MQHDSTFFKAAKTFLAPICQGLGSSVKEIETRRDFDRIGKGVRTSAWIWILKEGRERRSREVTQKNIIQPKKQNNNKFSNWN